MSGLPPTGTIDGGDEKGKFDLWLDRAMKVTAIVAGVVTVLKQHGLI
jgi:hypothetical protein